MGYLVATNSAGRDPKSLKSALLDTGKGAAHGVINLIEGVVNLTNAALPGDPYYAPFLSWARPSGYDTPLFGESIEFVTGLGAVKLLGVFSRSTKSVQVDVKPGEFSIYDWNGYPAGVPKPTGPFRLLEGAEYGAARDAANSANRALRKDLNLVGQKVDIHEIQPIKFNGSATDSANKVVLDRTIHRQQVTPWWNTLQRALEKQ